MGCLLARLGPESFRDLFSYSRQVGRLCGDVRRRLLPAVRTEVALIAADRIDQPPDAPASLLSPEALALIDQVIAAREAYRTADLSKRAADILIGLGYWSPGELTGVYWDDQPGRPGLGGRIAAAQGCGPVTLKELHSFHNRHW